MHVSHNAYKVKTKRHLELTGWTRSLTKIIEKDTYYTKMLFSSSWTLRTLLKILTGWHEMFSACFVILTWCNVALHEPYIRSMLYQKRQDTMRNRRKVECHQTWRYWDWHKTKISLKLTFDTIKYLFDEVVLKSSTVRH